MLTKITKRLFKGTYQYKIVLVCPGASLFRNGDMDNTLEQLKKLNVLNLSPKKQSLTSTHLNWRAGIKSPEDLDYAFKLQKQLKKIQNIDLRVESPYISVYTNSKSDVDSLAKLDYEKVKYVSVPPDNQNLDKDTIVMPKMDYDYRVTMGKTTQNYDSFISWAESNSKIRLTKSCKRDLAKDRSWGGTHFYIKGDNNLLMVKMHLGGTINKVERIIKA